MVDKIDFWQKVEVTPNDLALVRKYCGENKVPLDKIKLGETWEIRIFGGFTEFRYTIKKIAENKFYFDNFKISKYIFNKKLFDIKVKETLMEQKFFKVFDSPITDFAGNIIKEVKND